MRKFLLMLLYFALPAGLYIAISLLILPRFYQKANGPDTETQIRTSFRNALSADYDLLVVGNSRPYQGINPARFPMKAYNFSHDNDNFNQIYYKLVYLSQHSKKYSKLILGIDYFQFSFLSDTRNYVYGDLFSGDYMKDYSYPYAYYYVQNFFKAIDPARLKLLSKKKFLPRLTDLGQYIKPGVAKAGDTITRNIERLDIQVRYFEKILRFCEMQDISVFLLMMPVRPNEMRSYSVSSLSEFDNFLARSIKNRRKMHLLQYCTDPGYTLADYTDITHLNEAAANRFSARLGDTIRTLIASDDLQGF